MPGTRPVLTAAVNEETYDRWQRFAREQGCSVSALIEALGRMLPDDGEGYAWQRQAIVMARSIDADRRRRS